MLDKKDSFELETKKRKLVKKPSSLTVSDRLPKKAYEIPDSLKFAQINLMKKSLENLFYAVLRSFRF